LGPLSRYSRPDSASYGKRTVSHTHVKVRLSKMTRITLLALEPVPPGRSSGRVAAENVEFETGTFSRSMLRERNHRRFSLCTCSGERMLPYCAFSRLRRRTASNNRAAHRPENIPATLVSMWWGSRSRVQCLGRSPFFVRLDRYLLRLARNCTAA